MCSFIQVCRAFFTHLLFKLLFSLDISYMCVFACACVSLLFKSSYENIFIFCSKKKKFFIFNYGDTSVLHLLKKKNKIVLIYVKLLID